MRKIVNKFVALTAVLIFSASSFSFAAGGSIGYGDISVYKNDKLVTKLSGQNPIEDGSLLVCKGKCMIKSQGISLIGQDASKLAIANEDDTFKIFLKEGNVDYIINSNVRNITFYTPQGSYTIAEVVFNASGQSVVKGTITVDENGQTEISVTEGRLMFTTASGVKAVDANNKIVLAQAPDAPAQEADGAVLPFIGGAAALGFAATQLPSGDTPVSATPSE